jgi:mono/diheme cytochrome c family protein
MRGILSSTVVLWIVLPGNASGQTSGRDLYIARCFACHALDGSGESTIGRSLKLGDVRPVIRSSTDQQLWQIVRQGRGKMPGNKKLNDEQLQSLTLFLRDLVDGNPNAGRAVAEDQARPLANVKQVFRDKCSACHGQDGAGQTTVGKSEGIPDLTSVGVQSRSDEELQNVILNGAGRMPGYKKAFNPIQVSQFVSHIRGLTALPPPGQATAKPGLTIPSPSSAHDAHLPNVPPVEKKKTAPPITAAAPAKAKAPGTGRQIYMAKCSACHSRDGSGTGTIGTSMGIPSLTSSQVQARSDDSLAGVIRNGAGRMPAYKKKFNPEQIQLLVAYIRSLPRRQ